MTWDFEKGLLAFMAILVLGCLGTSLWMRSQTAELEDRQHMSEDQLARIGQRAQDIIRLKDEIRRDPVAKGVRGFEYLESQVVESRIGGKNDFAYDGTRQPKEFDGYMDQVYGVTPQKSKQGFTRDAIGTFLLHIEGNTARMKVTRLKLDAVDKKREVVDSWKPTIEVTDRQATALN